MPVSSDNRGQGSRSACPSICTHMGVTNSPGLCLPFFFFFFSSSLTVWAHLTFNDREQGVFVRHKPVWHYPEQQREFMAVFGAAARPWRWQNTCRNDVLMTAAQSPEGNRFRCKIGKKKKKRICLCLRHKEAQFKCIPNLLLNYPQDIQLKNAL